MIMRANNLPEERIRSIEKYRELFNEHLTEKFTAGQQIAFNDLYTELKDIFNRYCIASPAGAASLSAT
jgi:hypothetical protein